MTSWTKPTSFKLFYCIYCTVIVYLLGPYLQPGETGAIIVSGGQIISGGGRDRQYLKTVEVLREDGSPWCTLPDMEFARYGCLQL